MNVQVYSSLQHISNVFHFDNSSFKSLPRKWVRQISSFSVQPDVQIHIRKNKNSKDKKSINSINRSIQTGTSYIGIFLRNLKCVKVHLKVIHIFSSKNYDGAASSPITINSKKKLLKILLILQPPARVPHNSKYLGWRMGSTGATLIHLTQLPPRHYAEEPVFIPL